MTLLLQSGLLFAPLAQYLLLPLYNRLNETERWWFLQDSGCYCHWAKDGFHPYEWDRFAQPDEGNYKTFEGYVLQQDPLMYYLSIPSGSENARIIFRHFTDKEAFIAQYLRCNSSSETRIFHSIDIGGDDGAHEDAVDQFDPFLIHCVRNNHLWLIEWLLKYRNHSEINYNIFELNSCDSLLHVLSKNSHSPKHQDLIWGLIMKTNINMLHRDKSSRLFVDYIENVTFKQRLETLDKWTRNAVHHHILIGNQEKASELVDKVIAINEPLKKIQRMSLLSFAVLKAEIAIILKLLSRDTLDVTRSDWSGNTVLHIAVLAPLVTAMKVKVLDALFTHPMMCHLLTVRNFVGQTPWSVVANRHALKPWGYDPIVENALLSHCNIRVENGNPDLETVVQEGYVTPTDEGAPVVKPIRVRHYVANGYTKATDPVIRDPVIGTPIKKTPVSPGPSQSTPLTPASPSSPASPLDRMRESPTSPIKTPEKKISMMKSPQAEKIPKGRPPTTFIPRGRPPTTMDAEPIPRLLSTSTLSGSFSDASASPLS